MEAVAVDSLDLWTSSKVIGRECSTINKDYLLCKKKEGDNPALCLEQAKLVMSCGSGM